MAADMEIGAHSSDAIEARFVAYVDILAAVLGHGSGRTVEGILRGAVAAGGTQERGTDDGGRRAHTRRREASIAATFRRRIGLVGRECIGEASRARS